MMKGKGDVSMNGWQRTGNNQELAWLWRKGEGEERKPLAVCLAESEAVL